MPFVAETSDGVVAAARADRADDHRCLECGGPVSLRRAHRREGELVRPHFMHPGDDGCSPGESERHRWMKAMAFAKAQERWPDADVEYEGIVGNRRADVLVRFADPAPGVKRAPGSMRANDALAIEVQHRHESKERGAVTTDYLNQGVAILWLEPGFFEGGVDESFSDVFHGWSEHGKGYSAADREHNPRDSDGRHR